MQHSPLKMLHLVFERTILLNQRSGTNLYILHVTSVSAGSFAVTFYTTGGVAVDAPVTNFAIVKAVTA